jgi:nucleoside-diphosphate-sugar epimerase
LITGGSGFLGKYLISEFESDDCIVLGSGDFQKNVDLSNTIPDFNDKFDLVIHAAGKAHFSPKSIQEQDIFFTVNVNGTINLLKGLEKKNIPDKFVFISSVAVYGLIEGENIIESTCLNATDAYGKSKIVAEKIIEAWCKNNNVVCTILRLPLIIGEMPNGNLATMIKGIQNNYYFNIAGGNAKRSMVLAEDVAKIIKYASSIGGTFNLTDGYHPSYYELSHLFLRKFNKKIIYNMPFFIAKFFALFGDLFGANFLINTERFKKMTSSLTFDDSRARNEINWSSREVLKNDKLF